MAKTSGMCKQEGPGQDRSAQPSSHSRASSVSPNISAGEGSPSASSGSPTGEEDASQAGREGEAPAERFGVHKCPTECLSFICPWAVQAVPCSAEIVGSFRGMSCGSGEAQAGLWRI